MGNVQGGPQDAIGASVDIHGRRMKIERQLGEGGFAYVFKVVEESSGNAYALKRILAADSETNDIAEQEIKVMKQCTSKNIIGYKGHTKITRPKRDGHRSPVEYFLLMEFCPGGTMTSYLDSRHGQPFPEQQVLCMALDICEGVRALHSQPQPICHRDLKLDNVLLASDKTWKLCDFGSSTTRIKAYGTKEEITLEEETIQKYTTPSYRAPEMANLWQRKVVGPKADIWALGCIIYAIAFLRHPFQGATTLTIPKSSTFSSGFHSLLRDIFTEDPEKRPDIDEVIDEIKCLQRGGKPSRSKAGTKATKKAVAESLPAKSKSKKKPVVIDPPSGAESSEEFESSPSSSSASSSEKDSDDDESETTTASSSPSPPPRRKSKKKQPISTQKGKPKGPRPGPATPFAGPFHAAWDAFAASDEKPTAASRPAPQPDLLSLFAAPPPQAPSVGYNFGAQLANPAPMMMMPASNQFVAGQQQPLPSQFGGAPAPPAQQPFMAFDPFAAGPASMPRKAPPNNSATDSSWVQF
ncbi:non-specific serine/threonine protein kinase [Plasmodiophora brassicae]|uniref:non-specific serine/threonine protein kinase n=1 Tax=Plasmodiophora brassicae TaxID=37360 RepID=A0A3P3XZ33_PLABS|nr:unnamed protein product [Plasmodiophora brassicae]